MINCNEVDEKNILSFLFELGFKERKYFDLKNYEKPANYSDYRDGKIKYLRYNNSIFECDVEVNFGYDIYICFVPLNNNPIIEKLKFITSNQYYKYFPVGNEPFSYSHYLDNYQRTLIIFKHFFKPEIRKLKIKKILNVN